MDTAKALEILGLTGNPSPADIKKAYRQQVKIWHPDRYSEGTALKQLAERNIQDANLAYTLLKQQVSEAPRERRPAANASQDRTDKPPPPTATPPIKRGFRFLAVLRSIDLDKILERMRFWLQTASRNRFRPWYRYPASSGKPGDQATHVNFDHVLQDAMQNRAALKRIHRARRRTGGCQGCDTVPPVAAAAKPHRPKHTPSSEEG